MLQAQITQLLPIPGPTALQVELEMEIKCCMYSSTTKPLKPSGLDLACSLLVACTCRQGWSEGTPCLYLYRQHYQESCYSPVSFHWWGNISLVTLCPKKSSKGIPQWKPKLRLNSESKILVLLNLKVSWCKVLRSRTNTVQPWERMVILILSHMI